MLSLENILRKLVYWRLNNCTETVYLSLLLQVVRIEMGLHFEKLVLNFLKFIAIFEAKQTCSCSDRKLTLTIEMCMVVWKKVLTCFLFKNGKRGGWLRECILWRTRALCRDLQCLCHSNYVSCPVNSYCICHSNYFSCPVNSYLFSGLLTGCAGAEWHNSVKPLQ